MTKNDEIIQITPCFNNGHIHIFEVNVKVCWDKNTFHVELKIEHKFTMSAKGNLMALEQITTDQQKTNCLCVLPWYHK